MGENVGVLESGEIQGRAHGQEAEAGLGHGQASLTPQHDVKLRFQGVQVQDVTGSVMPLLIAELLGTPVGALLLLRQLDPQKLAAQILQAVPVGIGARQLGGDLGAVDRHGGHAQMAIEHLFEAASTGTLFLDEIGELDIKTQVKLLRVLDGVPYYRLGGTRKVTVDVRVVAATNVNLEDAIQAGKFRTDLYHRLNPIQIRVPALRERTEDVGPLAAFFLQQHDPRRRFTPEAVEVLERYSWPGNVRELRNVVTRAAIYSVGEEIGPPDLPHEIAGKRPPAVASQETGSYSLDGLEQTTIFTVLAQTGGHQQKAADILGISRRTLIRKLKLYRGTPCESVA